MNGIGWVGWEGFDTRNELLRNLAAPSDVIARALTPEPEDPDELWTVELYHGGIPTIVCRPMKRSPSGGWMVRAYAVHAGDAPARTNCPVPFLDLAPDRGGESTLWRLKVQLGDDEVDMSLLEDGCLPLFPES